MKLRKKLFKLLQMLMGMGMLKGLDYFIVGNTFIIVLKLIITIYITYLAISLLYGQSSDSKEESE